MVSLMSVYDLHVRHVAFLPTLNTDPFFDKLRSALLEDTGLELRCLTFDVAFKKEPVPRVVQSSATTAWVFKQNPEVEKINTHLVTDTVIGGYHLKILDHALLHIDLLSAPERIIQKTLEVSASLAMAPFHIGVLKHLPFIQDHQGFLRVLHFGDCVAVFNCEKDLTRSGLEGAILLNAPKTAHEKLAQEHQLKSISRFFSNTSKLGVKNEVILHHAPDS